MIEHRQLAQHLDTMIAAQETVGSPRTDPLDPTALLRIASGNSGSPTRTKTRSGPADPAGAKGKGQGAKPYEPASATASASASIRSGHGAETPQVLQVP